MLFLPGATTSEERYQLCEDQLAQIDCRIAACRFHLSGMCINVSPAITLNEGGKFICWSQEQRTPLQVGEPVRSWWRRLVHHVQGGTG